jgi:hypothetical protein
MAVSLFGRLFDNVGGRLGDLPQFHNIFNDALVQHDEVPSTLARTHACW